MSVEFSQQREKLSTKHTHPAGLVRPLQATPGEREGGRGSGNSGCDTGEQSCVTIRATGLNLHSQGAEEYQQGRAGWQQWLAKLNTLVLFCDKPQH